MGPLELTFCSDCYQTSLKQKVQCLLDLHFSFEDLKYLVYRYKLFVETFIDQLELYCIICVMIPVAYLITCLFFNQPDPTISMTAKVVMIQKVFLNYFSYRFKKVQHCHNFLVFAHKLVNYFSCMTNLAKMYFQFYFIKSIFLKTLI